MRERRSLADSFNGHGSEGMATRARRRRLLAESSEQLGRCQAQERGSPGASGGAAQNGKKAEAPVQYGPQEWRDWANLLPDLVGDVSGRLLSHDVAEYHRFRAVCKPWRELTADPRARLLDSRFRPRNWMVPSIFPDAGSGRGLLNLATAASLVVDLPALSTHCHVGAADGLLVLFHKPSKAIRLLDPLSNAVTEFPPISSIVDAKPPSSCGYLSAVFRIPWTVLPQVVNGAGFDDSTSPPTLVLCLREGVTNIIFARPGDAHWTLVSSGQAFNLDYDVLGRLLYYTVVSMGGRCYVSSPEGSVYQVELRPLPRLVEVVDQRRFAEHENISFKRIISFLVAGAGGRMLMVRYWRGIEHFGGAGAYERQELFTVDGLTSRVEVLEVDMANRRLLPVRSLGRSAVFVGLTHCLHISTETFPSIVADAIYLGCLHQQSRKFSIYHINKKNHRRTEPPHKFVFSLKKNHRRTEPPHKFVFSLDRGLAPAASPCNLDQYLVCYADRSHNHNNVCINHGTRTMC